ncbi:TatD family hydrolase [Candidatus Jorgensenbacteria bacterium]|nr:TatD family hydrolase [Candidatus Jorgensenbacteria bacterium]
MQPMRIHYLDAHTHVQFAAFEKDYRDVIARALTSGVGLVNVGTQEDTSRRAVEIAEEYKQDPVYAVIGLHPIHTFHSYHDPKELGGLPTQGFISRAESFNFDYYKVLVRHPKVLAIGECGLDYYHLPKDFDRVSYVEKQKDAFLAQIELSRESKKPLMIHCREAFSDLIDILYLKSNMLNSRPGIIHFFSGTMDDAKKLVDLGFYFTFGGVITFVRAYDEVVRYIPIDRILSETDAPYVSPVPYRGKRNEPAYVIEIVRGLADLKGCSFEKMREQILDNARAIFGSISPIVFNYKD